MEDLVSMCERRCRKACNLRSAAEDSEEACHSGSSGGRARRYRKRGSPKPAAGDAEAMDTDPSPVRLWESEGHSDGYRTCFPSESEEMSAPTARAHTASEPALKHDAQGLERPARARTAPVPRHRGPEMDAIGDTPMGDESEAPGTAGCAGSGGKHAECHCEHVSFLMGKYPKMGMDAMVHRLDSLDNAKDGLEEDVAGILDDQSAAERDMSELRAEQAQYRENLELALQKQQRVVDSLLNLVEDMSGRLTRLEELQPLTSGLELPAKPAAAELVERVKTLRSAMDKPMGGPAEAPYAPPRVDPGTLPFVPMFSESTMLGEHTAPAGSMREGHVTTDPRSPTVQMSHAAQDLPITTTAHAVYAEEEIQSQTMQGRTMGSADGHGRCHSGGNLWAKDPNTARGYGRPMEQVLPAFQTLPVQAQLDRTPWRRGMYGECTHTPRPQVVSVSVEWWLGTSEPPSGLTTSGESKSPTTIATPPTWMTSSWIGRTSPRRSSVRCGERRGTSGYAGHSHTGWRRT